MNGLKKLKGLVACLSIIVLSMSLVGCGKKEEESKKKETPFAEQYEFQYSKSTDTIETPIYFYCVDGNRNRIDVPGVEFAQSSLKTSFRDFNRSEPDENGNVTISYVCDISVNMEISIAEGTSTTEWYYTYYEISPSAFDYNTGKVFLTSRVSVGGDYQIMENGIEKKDANEMKYTDVSFNGKEIKVGRRDEVKFNGWGKVEDLGVVDGKHKYKNSASTTMTYYYSVPKDYDGIVIAIRKMGSTKELFDESEKEYNELIKLQKEAEETGVKSERLIEIENKKDEVYKIIDPDNEERKDRKPEDYYVIKVSDALNNKE
ncbi:MAG: hypothetical protein IKE91_03715 [Clostridia bacterium]|nr:hypothetical protein [Clostridia bacterium]